MPESQPSPPRLLVIDDDSDLRLFLKDLLTEEGYVADVAATMDEALALIDQRVYHLILTDLLTHVSGDPLRSATSLLRYAHPTPVVALTGWSVTAAEVTRAGLARLISKPFDLDALLAEIADCLTTTFSGGRQNQAEVLGRYCQAFNAHDFDTCASLCAETVRYTRTGDILVVERDDTLTGREAMRDALERLLQRYPDVRFDDYLIFQQPKGLALRCVKSWQAPHALDGRASTATSMLFLFTGEQIGQISMRMDGQPWHALIAEAVSYSPSAHDSQD